MKNVMKKMIAAAVMLSTLSLAGCGGSKNENASNVSNAGNAGNVGNSAASQAAESTADTDGSKPADGTSDNSEASADASAPSGDNTADLGDHPFGEWDELDQAAITKDMGMGWNLGNQLEALIISDEGTKPSETGWGNPVIDEKLLRAVKDAGFSTVRIPVSYFDMIGGAPDYTVNAEWFDRVQEVVDYVVGNDMYAIINMHGDGYYTIDNSWLLCAEDDQTEIKAKYEAVWRQIAERFKGYDEHLIFESMNEEFDNTYGSPDLNAYSNINDYNQIFVDTVRTTGGNNTKRWVLIPGWNTNINYTTNPKAGFVIPEDTHCESDGNRIMISVHYYDPYNFALNEDDKTAKPQWGKYAVENYDSSGESHVTSQMKKLSDYFTSKGYPVVIGEMGAQDKSHLDENQPEFRRYWYEYVIREAKKAGCVPVYWDNGWHGKNGFSLFNRYTFEQFDPELIEAIMRAINSDDYEITPPAGFETPRKDTEE